MLYHGRHGGDKDGDKSNRGDRGDGGDGGDGTEGGEDILLSLVRPGLDYTRPEPGSPSAHLRSRVVLTFEWINGTG